MKVKTNEACKVAKNLSRIHTLFPLNALDESINVVYR